MWKFLIFILLFSLLSQGGTFYTFKSRKPIRPKKPICEMENKIFQKNILESNKILNQNLKNLLNRFEEQEKLLKNISQSCSAISHETENNPPNSSKNKTVIRNCADIFQKRYSSGVYNIETDSNNKNAFEVYCDKGWTVIQRRLNGSVDFYRDWNSYKTGFGNLEGEFFIGLDKLHALTAGKPQELRITLGDFEGATKYANYDAFEIASEEEKYALKALGAYSGNAGDSLSYHLGSMFTTHDNDNDLHIQNCAVRNKGAWWYNHCEQSNLNGLYLMGKTVRRFEGAVWSSWRGFSYSLKTTEMKIRPKQTPKNEKSPKISASNNGTDNNLTRIEI